ncbi:MAG TPA: hypothetical protein VIF12_03665 [Micavibrio sp.]
MYKTENTDPRFAAIRQPRNIWAIPAIHAETERLMALHDGLYSRIRPGDRIVYHGNYTGYGPQAVDTVNEILAFRRSVMALPGMMADDIVYLRGSQEELWEKLLQIPFARNPIDVLRWMLDNGIAPTLASYGINPRDGLLAAHEGITALTRWVAKIRAAIRRHPGHEMFTAHWRRAAYTASDNSAPLLFVHAGIDPARTLQEQGDSFWWAGKNFNDITAAYDPFAKVIRGYDPGHGGLHLNCVIATIDAGCGFGGQLVGAGITPRGEVFDLLET